MKRRLTTIVGAAVPVLCFALIAVCVVLELNNHGLREETSLGEDLIWLLAWQGFPIVGAILIARVPRNPIGWLLATTGLGVALLIASGAYARFDALQEPLPLAGVASWLFSWVGVPAFTSVAFVIALFPSGRIASPIWRRVTLVAAAVAITEIVLASLRVHPEPVNPEVVNPLGIRSAAPLIESTIPVLGFVLACYAVATIVHLVVRFRRARGEERQQLRWFVYSAAMFPILFISMIGLYSLVPTLPFDPVFLAFFVSFIGMATAIGVAVTRYGLYEIDRVVNRALVYAAVSVVLVGLYATVVLLPSTLLHLGDSDILVAAATLASAAAFRPIRGRVQAFVDRRFYRSRFDAVRAAEQFGLRVREAVDLDSVSGELTAAVRGTVAPAHVALWVRP